MYWDGASLFNASLYVILSNKRSTSTNIVLLTVLNVLWYLSMCLGIPSLSHATEMVGWLTLLKSFLMSRKATPKFLKLFMTLRIHFCRRALKVLPPFPDPFCFGEIHRFSIPLFSTFYFVTNVIFSKWSCFSWNFKTTELCAVHCLTHFWVSS